MVSTRSSNEGISGLELTKDLIPDVVLADEIPEDLLVETSVVRNLISCKETSLKDLQWID